MSWLYIVYWVCCVCVWITGGFLCHWDAGWTPVLAAGHGLGNHQNQGHRQEGQWWGMVPCGLSAGRTLRYTHSSPLWRWPWPQRLRGRGWRIIMSRQDRTWTFYSKHKPNKAIRLPSVCFLYLIDLGLFNLILKVPNTPFFNRINIQWQCYIHCNMLI